MAIPREGEIMLPDFIRKRIPIGLKENLSKTLLSQMGKYKWTYWLYSEIIDDGYPTGIEFLPQWNFGYNYKGHFIILVLMSALSP